MLTPESLAELRRLAEAANADAVQGATYERDWPLSSRAVRQFLRALNPDLALDLLDAAAERDALAARLAASEAIGGYAVIHEWPHPNGSLALGFASSPHLDFDAADNHLAYCEAMQERGQRGSDGRYFIAKWSPVDALDGADR